MDDGRWTMDDGRWNRQDAKYAKSAPRYGMVRYYPATHNSSIVHRSCRFYV
ncbi:MAG TPA: hypothetical protein VF952_15430 [Chloroflexia bacterium]